MRTVIVLALVILGAVSAADAAPTVSLSPRVIHEGETVTATGRGFTPGGNLLAHLVRPDGTEYPEMQLVADSRGGVSHLIRIILILTGSYELQMIDLASKTTAVSRFMVVEGTLPAALRAGLVPSGLTIDAGDFSPARLPAVYTGVWQGSVQRPGGPASQSVLVTLSGGEIGGVVGTITYPMLACGGELWLMNVAGDEPVLLGEHITYGEDRCTGHGIVSIRPVKDGALEIQRTDAEHPAAPPAVGVLPRRM